MQDLDFDKALGAGSNSVLDWLYQECFEDHKIFTLRHALRNGYRLWHTDSSAHSFLKLCARLYIKKHDWNCAVPAINFKQTLIDSYKLNKPHRISPQQAYLIPPIIHQIWLGSPFPEQYKMWQKTWQLRGWHYKLWTDRDIETLNLENYIRYKNSHNYGERSDIARYEILYRYGGLYVDTDFECLNPQAFEELHRLYNFYGCLQPLDIRSFALANGIIASQPYHPIMRAMIDHLKHHPTPPNTPIWLTAGPVPFTQMVARYIDTPSLTTIVFPPPVFFPTTFLGYRHYPKAAIAQHHWQASWNTQQAKVSS